MNKKNKKIIIILFSILVIFFVYRKYVCNPILTMNINWNLKLPYTTKIIHYQDEGSSFLGDGIRYTIVEYKSTKKIKKLNNIDWTKTRDVNIENEINSLLNRLIVDKKYDINFSDRYKYYIETDSDSSKRYIIYSYDNNILYIVEDIR